MSSTRKPRSLEQRVAAYLHARGVPPGARILVAFSGGPDSRALLEILAGLAPSYPLRLRAAHLDHGLRPAGERAAEGELVRRCCERLGVALSVGRLRPGRLAERCARGGRSLEEAARAARYRFLRGCLGSTGSDYLALGHTLDDHLETLVMRFFQGSGIQGLQGIPPARGAILRPLRGAARVEIEAWLRERGLGHHFDASNEDLRFLRNAVRHRLLPVIAEVFPGHRGSLLRLSRTMRQVGKLLAAECRRRLPWRPEGAGYSIDAGRFLAAPGVLRIESVYRLADRWGTRYTRLPRRFLEILGDTDALRKRRLILEGHGLLLCRRGSRLFLERDVVGNGKKGYFIPVIGGSSTRVPEAGLAVCLPQLPEADASLVIRSPQVGDRIGMSEGSKQVRKLFSEWKVPPRDRWKIPVIDSAGGILAVLGTPLGYSDRFRTGLSEEARLLLAGCVQPAREPS
jgi:tRNA(Ile)-lysidine synthetase-like protein